MTPGDLLKAYEREMRDLARARVEACRLPKEILATRREQYREGMELAKLAREACRVR